jgi:two-component system, OmpR family, catabolic regulation response regulator CreB
MQTHVLIVEDEPTIADTLIYALKTEGFQVTWVSLASAAHAQLATKAVNFVVLDIGLPDQNGFELCKIIRASGAAYADVPILFLTARKEEVDRIIGLEIGGDDYVTKPFSPREITARIKTILKRTQASQVATLARADTEPQQVFSEGTTQGNFYVELVKARVTYCAQPLALTRYEFLILTSLLAQPERVFSRAQLMDKVWDEPESSFERAVDTHIKSLRAKLREAANLHPLATDPIKTHRGMGYSISVATL